MDDKSEPSDTPTPSDIALDETHIDLEPSAPPLEILEDEKVIEEPLVPPEIAPSKSAELLKHSESAPRDTTVCAELLKPDEDTSKNVCDELRKSREITLEEARISAEAVVPREIILEDLKVSPELPAPRETPLEEVNVAFESPGICGAIPEDGDINLESLMPCKRPVKVKVVQETPEWLIRCGVAQCPSEYGEGGLVIRRPSDEISWQHFPRSTSTISSSCHLSSDERKSVSIASKKSSVSSKHEKSERSSRSSLSSGPVVMTIQQLQADHYLRIRYIYEFFNFLIGHLVSKEPDDPIQFLVKLIDQCLLARDGKVEPPLLFDDEHVHSVYRAFDPFARGSISYQQYQEAMRTLGLSNKMTPYDRNPSVDDKNFVKESTFKNEVKRCQLENFKKMTRIPKKWEENRLLWLKRMGKRPGSLTETSEETSEEEEVCDEECICEECPIVKKEVSKKTCPYPVPHALRHEIALKHEPEQLYLIT